MVLGCRHKSELKLENSRENVEEIGEHKEYKAIRFEREREREGERKTNEKPSEDKQKRKRA